MPISIAWQQCYYTGNVPDDYAGKTVRCPRCRTKIGVSAAPPPSSVVPQSLPSSSGLLPPAPTGNPNFAFTDDALGDSASSTDSEPWYYRYCHGMTLVLLVLTLAGVLLGFVLFVGFMFIGLAMSKKPAPDGTLGFMASLGASSFISGLIFAIIALYHFSFVLIFIDAARHVRKLYALMAGRRN